MEINKNGSKSIRQMALAMAGGCGGGGAINESMRPH